MRSTTALRMSSFLCLSFVSFGAAAAASQPPLPIQYQFSIFPDGVPTPTYANVALYAINNNNLVLGLNNTSGDWFIAYPPYTESTITTLRINNSQNIFFIASGINANNQVYGTLSEVNARAFVRHPNGQVRYYQAPQGYYIINLNALNDYGVAVGTYASTNGSLQSFPFILDTVSGTFNPLDLGTGIPIPAGFITPSTINNLGQIAGTYTTNPNAAQSTGFFYDPNNNNNKTFFLNISYPGQNITAINDMNFYDQFVGYYATFPNRFFVGQVSNGSSLQFAPLPSDVGAYGINDAGVIVGFNQSMSSPFPLIGRPVNTSSVATTAAPSQGATTGAVGGKMTSLPYTGMTPAPYGGMSPAPHGAQPCY